MLKKPKLRTVGNSQNRGLKWLPDGGWLAWGQSAKNRSGG
jgi:hypothetical protein